MGEHGRQRGVGGQVDLGMDRTEPLGPPADLVRRLLGRDVQHPAAAARPDPASAWRSTVDFPTPGSPPSSVTEPGTTPPPSTRSSSATPVGIGSTPSIGTSPIGRAGSTTAPIATAAGGASTSSTIVFHSPQPSHRPAHLGARRRRTHRTGSAVLRRIVAVMWPTLRTASDTRRGPQRPGAGPRPREDPERHRGDDGDRGEPEPEVRPRLSPDEAAACSRSSTAVPGTA